MSTDDDLWERGMSFWGLSTGFVFAFIVWFFILSQEGPCVAKYAFVISPAARTDAIKSDWICNQAINGVDPGAIGLLGIVVGLGGILVTLLIIVIRNARVSEKPA